MRHSNLNSYRCYSSSNSIRNTSTHYRLVYTYHHLHSVYFYMHAYSSPSPQGKPIILWMYNSSHLCVFPNSMQQVAKWCLYSLDWIAGLDYWTGPNCYYSQLRQNGIDICESFTRIKFHSSGAAINYERTAHSSARIV